MPKKEPERNSRADMEKRWAKMETFKQTPYYKRLEKLAAEFIDKLRQENMSVSAAIEVLNIARNEIWSKDYEFRGRYYPETIAPHYSRKRTTWLNEVFDGKPDEILEILEAFRSRDELKNLFEVAKTDD